jgi:hypothetical protein
MTTESGGLQMNCEGLAFKLRSVFHDATIEIEREPIKRSSDCAGWRCPTGINGHVSCRRWPTRSRTCLERDPNASFGSGTTLLISRLADG